MLLIICECLVIYLPLHLFWLVQLPFWLAFQLAALAAADSTQTNIDTE